MKAYEIILDQLGGRKFTMMTGARLMHEGDNKLVAKIKGSRKCNHLEVSLNSMDLYDIRFCKIGTQKTMFAIKNDRTFNNIHCEDMKGLIEEQTELFLSL